MAKQTNPERWERIKREAAALGKDPYAMLEAVLRAERSEHNFTGSAEQWERRVFNNATTFRLHRFNRNGSHDEAEAATFPLAVTTAMHSLDDPENPGARVLLYAVSASGRHTLIPQAKWPEYLELWDQRGEDK